MDDINELDNKIEKLEEKVEEITSLVSDKKDSDGGKSEKNNVKEEKKIDFNLENLNLSKSNVINILEDLRVIKKRFSHIENIFKEAERAQYSPSRDLPGLTGVYNGEHMVSSDGVKHEVPKNYAAKSLLVNGDKLKMIEQDSKVAFKILEKVPRKKIEGLLSKKDGKYVILSDSGTFNLLKSAVEFRNIKQGEWVLAVIPEIGSANNFAAIDKVIKKEPVKEVKFYEKPVSKPQVSQISKPYTSEQPKRFEPQRPVILIEPTDAPKQPYAPKEPEQPKNPMPKIQFSDEDLV